MPESRAALDNMKFEIANQLGVNLKQGYNGNLTSRENGYVGGYMVKNITPIRTKVFSRFSRTAVNYEREIRYDFEIVL